MIIFWVVVYRTIPTSNHNHQATKDQNAYVVYRTIPTSNHNQVERHSQERGLYIVLFLHQTTTEIMQYRPFLSCISYYSYIKPQLLKRNLLFLLVVYRTIPTSNHNCESYDLSND